MPSTEPNLPDGYSFVDYTFYGRTRRGLWFAIKREDIIYSCGLFTLDDMNTRNFLIVDENGNAEFNYVNGKIDYYGNTARPIKVSEFPEDGMTVFHTHFNETLKKFELPIINNRVHTHHEYGHDSDVAAAVAAICECRIDLLHRKAILANLNPDQTARANTAYAGFDDCIDEIVDANAEPAIERAYLKSLGDIRHNGELQPERYYVNDAHDFAASAIAVISGKTTGQLTAHRYQYYMCLIDELNKDRDRTGSARFLPKGVKLVKTLSTPKDKTEVTETALFRKLRGRIVPSEGAPKQPV